MAHGALLRAVPTHPSLVMRDATYSAETQHHLKSLLTFLEDSELPHLDRQIEITALRDVVERWDSNDETEYVPLDPGARACGKAVEQTGRMFFLPCRLSAGHDGGCESA